MWLAGLEFFQISSLKIKFSTFSTFLVLFWPAQKVLKVLKTSFKGKREKVLKVLNFSTF